MRDLDQSRPCASSQEAIALGILTVIYRRVEVMQGNELIWRTSSYCESSSCIEVAVGVDRVYLRDSKDPDGAVLIFSRRVWEEFVRSVRSDEIIK